MRGWSSVLPIVLLTVLPAGAGTPQAGGGAGPGPAPLTPAAIDGATFAPRSEKDPEQAEGEAGPGQRPDPLIVKVQVLLDRARFSPGAIDGLAGDNLRGALEAFAVAHGLPATRDLTPELFEALQETRRDPVVTAYTITEADVAGPFTGTIPAEMERQADLKALGYTEAREMLAERFHMQRDLLSALNPGKAFDRAGTIVTVTAVSPMATGKVADAPEAPRVARVEVDKAARRVRTFDADGALLGDFPATVGSAEKPAPTGTFEVTGVAFNPTYTYDPKFHFEGVEARTAFSIPPGANNPVGLVWIDLSKPSYGIHGTPDPEKIGKTASHGCVRLTNWDARDLAEHVRRGARVDFKD